MRLNVGDISTTSDVPTQRMLSNRTQAKCWCFTINNSTPKDEEIDKDLFTYLIIGREVGEQGTPHLQGYAIMPKQTTLVGMKKLFPRAHLEVAKGSPEQNKIYCSKDGKFQEFGVFPKSTTVNATLKRKANYELALQKAKQQRLYEIDPGVLIRHMSSLKQIARDHPPNLKLTMSCVVCGLWSPWLRQIEKCSMVVSLMRTLSHAQWRDGYQNQPYVSIDDFDSNHVVFRSSFKDFGLITILYC